jgi:hypothetical protein
MTGRELAQEFTQIWDALDTDDINAVLANNVSLDLLEFFVSYAERFAAETAPDEEAPSEMINKLPNLLIIGYLIRLLEERVH